MPYYGYYGGYGDFLANNIYCILLIPVLLLSLWAQAQVSGNFKRYSGVANRRRLTGAQAAEAVLRYAFDVLDLEEVHLFVEKENKVSVKLAETLLIKVPGGRKEKWQGLAHFWWENQNFS